MKIHVLITFFVGCGFEEPGPTALDLNTAARFLLDVLHVGAAMANNLGTQVEAWDRF